MLTTAEKKAWEVYIQPPLYGPEKLIEYLGRYVFRIAISNHRILDVKDGRVTFEYYDNRDKEESKAKLKQMTLSAVEFIGRFLAHVLPSHFVRIRHFGFPLGYIREISSLIGTGVIREGLLRLGERLLRLVQFRRRQLRRRPLARMQVG